MEPPSTELQDDAAIQDLHEPPSSSSSVPLSKNAQKKLAKAARFAEQKKERRAFEKEKKKQKKRERAAQQKEEGTEGNGRPEKKARVDAGPKQPFGARIVVDLGFDELMSENEIKSLTSQLAFTYSANRKAVQPFSSLLFTSLNGRTFTRLESISSAAYKRWVDTDWWSESYEQLWEALESNVEAGEVAGNEELLQVQGSTRKSETSRQRKPQRAPRETIVYLTADSTEELEELKDNETYIIGGICDHNRYKNLCLKKSQDTKIRSARLPIGTYLSELKTRKVLTVNQTFEILLKWVETKDWEQALYAVVPKRKFQGQEKGHAETAADEREADDDEGEPDTENQVFTVLRDADGGQDDGDVGRTGVQDSPEGSVPVVDERTH